VEVNNLPLSFSRVYELNEETNVVFECLILVSVLVAKDHVCRIALRTATNLFNELSIFQLLLRSNELLYGFRIFIFSR